MEVKYAFLRSYWGQGLATEAVAALLAFAGEILGIEHVIATVAPDNTASHRVLAKARMTTLLTLFPSERPTFAIAMRSDLGGTLRIGDNVELT